MNKLKILPATASVREMQRNYKKIIDYVNRTKEPLYLLSNNKPKVVILDIKVFTNLLRDHELTEEELFEIIDKGDIEYQQGKAKVLTSLKDLR